MSGTRNALRSLSAPVLVALALSVLFVPDASRAAVADGHRPGSSLVWDQPGSRVRLPNGWTVTTTPGPMIEVRDGINRLLGVMELGNYVLEPELAKATSPSRVSRALRARAQRFHEVVGRDRAEQADGYRYRAGSTKRVRWGDERAIRYRATVEDATGRTVERILGYQAVHRGHLWILTVSGVGDGKPLDGEDVLSVEEHGVLAKYLDDVLKMSPLPEAGTAIEDGIVAGTEGGLDGGRLWLIWNGSKQRIYQSRGMTREEAGRYSRGPRIAQVVVSGRRTGSQFAIVPFDGPEARLHVLVGGALHEVVVTQVRTPVIDALPTLNRPVMDRLMVPTP